MTSVTAAVVSYSTAHHLPGVLASLAAQTHRDLEVVVIDNASHDHSVAVARDHGAHVIANRTNRGYAGAANQAAALATDALLLLNPDVRLAPDAVEQAVAALEAHPRTASVQPRLTRLGQPVIDTTGHVAFATRLFRNRGEGEPDDGRYAEPGEVFGVSGAAALYRVAALEDAAVDGRAFDEALFAFFEDVDLDWRLRLRGWQARYEPAARGEHERGGAGVRRSAVVERLNFTNRLAVVIANDDPRAAAAHLHEIAGTTALKAVELACTVPSAFLTSLPRLAHLLPHALRRREKVMARSLVDPADVAATWFGPFDYAAWVRTWWRRVRGHGPLRP